MARIKAQNIEAVNRIVRSTTQEHFIENRRNVVLGGNTKHTYCRMIRVIHEKHPSLVT